jgi:hypothetical protein
MFLKNDEEICEDSCPDYCSLLRKLSFLIIELATLAGRWGKNKIIAKISIYINNYKLNTNDFIFRDCDYCY